MKKLTAHGSRAKMSAGRTRAVTSNVASYCLENAKITAKQAPNKSEISDRGTAPPDNR